MSSKENTRKTPTQVRKVFVVAAVSLLVLASGCGSDTTGAERAVAAADTAADAAGAAADSVADAVDAVENLLPGRSKGAPQNGTGIVYHRSDCSHHSVRWYGAGGEGRGQPCGQHLLERWQIDVIHSFDWNFRLEDLVWLNTYYYVDYARAVNMCSNPLARCGITNEENRFFDAVNRINGGRGNAFTDLINVNLPGAQMQDGKPRPGRGL